MDLPTNHNQPGCTSKKERKENSTMSDQQHNEHKGFIGMVKAADETMDNLVENHQVDLALGGLAAISVIAALMNYLLGPDQDPSPQSILMTHTLPAIFGPIAVVAFGMRLLRRTRKNARPTPPSED
jgi:hypothetical protein